MLKNNARKGQKRVTLYGFYLIGGVMATAGLTENPNHFQSEILAPAIVTSSSAITTSGSALEDVFLQTFEEQKHRENDLKPIATEAPEVDEILLAQEEENVAEEKRILAVAKQHREEQQEVARQDDILKQKIKMKAEMKIKIQKRYLARQEAKRLARKRAREKAARDLAAGLFSQFLYEEDLLAIVLDLEAGSSTPKDMTGVGSVILNRLRTKYQNFRYLHSIHDVVYSPGQYGCIEKIPGHKPRETAKRIAHGLLTGEIECWPEYVLYQTTYRQSWMDGKVRTYEVSGVKEYYGIPVDFEEGCK